jgi:hypothetical protein
MVKLSVIRHDCAAYARCEAELETHLSFRYANHAGLY